MLSEVLRECEAVLRHRDMYYSGELCAELQRAFEEISSSARRQSTAVREGAPVPQGGIAGFSRVVVLDARRAVSPAGCFDFDVFIDVIARAITEALGFDLDTRNLHREQLSQLLKDERGILFCFFSLDHLTEEHYRQLRGLGFTQTDHRILFCGRSAFLRGQSTSVGESPGSAPAFSSVRAVQFESEEPSDEVMRDPTAHLRVVYGRDSSRLILIPPSGVTLGRVWSDGNGNLDDPTVSREHARIVCGWGTWSLCDLDSRNGSFVNARSVEPGTYAPLIDGSVICLGGTIAIFRTTPAADLSDPGDPPFGLRERRETILPWAQRFVLEARATLPADVWSPLAADCLVNYDWPDDLHELREVVQALVTGSRSFPIDHSDLPEKITARWKALRKAEPTWGNEVPEPALAAIEAALMETQGVVRRAAHLLGIPGRRLYRLCVKHGIEIDRIAVPLRRMPGENDHR